MNPPSNCLECSAPLTPADAGGLCPKCLLRLGLASQLAQGTLPATAAGLTPDGAVREPFDFGGYRILRLLGKGGMGAVYEAEHAESGRRVALKVLGTTLDTPEMRARFIREGQLAAAVRHPNTVAVFAAEEVEGAPVIAMEILPGGTLKDRVKRGGPLPVAEAVDAVLQIIDGLEAAHAGGVLHRDIKPANCFTAPDGSVKVGDFGLSISTLVRAEEQLTQTGAVLGTPAFASPEQLRAQEIDVRSDIYSVGATLYYLLTGKPTHDATTLVALIASVLERDPAEPALLRPEIPRDLSRVVMRCLARKADARFQDYAALRAALLPFRSVAPVPAKLGVRFLAGLIDLFVASLPLMVWQILKGTIPDQAMLIDRTPSAILIFFAAILWEIAAICVPEGLWGAGLGKAMCGLRVTRCGGGAPGLGRALARGAILVLAEYGTDAVTWLLRSGAEYREAVIAARFLPEEFAMMALSILLLSTMRRRNGWAAIHDLLTGTRVVNAPVAATRTPLPGEPAPAPVPTGERLGPFAVCARDGEMIVAFDEALRRRVWIRAVAPGTPAIGEARRDVSRAGRLRWLTGRRSAEENWDAYEAPDGAPLTGFLDGKQGWASVRGWLLDLADEFRAALDDATLPAETGPDRVWLTRDGHAVLLDFPAPGAPPQSARRIADQTGAQEFLDEIATAALAPRVPLHAREFLQTLRARRFESAALVAGNLHALLEKPAEVAEQRRLLSVIIAPLIALGGSLLIVLGYARDAHHFDARWAAQHPDRPSLRLILEVQYEQQLGGSPISDWCSVVLAGRYSDVIADEKFWQEAAAEDTWGGWRGMSEEAVRTHRNVSAEALQHAEQSLAPYLLKRREREASIVGRARELANPFVGFLTASMFIGLAGTLLMGVPPALRMNDLAIVNALGEPASRFRAFARGTLGWLPIFAGAVAVSVCANVPTLAGAFTSAAKLYGLVMFWVFYFALRHPARSLNDYFTRTWLVPR